MLRLATPSSQATGIVSYCGKASPERTMTDECSTIISLTTFSVLPTNSKFATRSFPRVTLRSLLLSLLLIIFFYSVNVVLNQRSFEHYLNSRSITFENFPSDYTEVLIAAHQEDRPIDDTNYAAAFHTDDSDAKIPSIIHFIWFKKLYDSHLDVSEIPTTGSQAPEHRRIHNPNFTVNVWNATAARDLIEEHYDWFLPTYDGYKHPIQRVDAFKYFVLWHFGGIYMDLDVDCRRPLDPLLQFAAWFPKTTLLGVNNDVFAARAQHPVIGEMKAQLKLRNGNSLFPYLTIYFSTGPQFASDVLKDWYLSGRDEREHDQDVGEQDAGKIPAGQRRCPGLLLTMAQTSTDSTS